MNQVPYQSQQYQYMYPPNYGGYDPYYQPGPPQYQQQPPHINPYHYNQGNFQHNFYPQPQPSPYFYNQMQPPPFHPDQGFPSQMPPNQIQPNNPPPQDQYSYYCPSQQPYPQEGSMFYPQYPPMQQQPQSPGELLQQQHPHHHQLMQLPPLHENKTALVGGGIESLKQQLDATSEFPPQFSMPQTEERVIVVPPVVQKKPSSYSSKKPYKDTKNIPKNYTKAILKYLKQHQEHVLQLIGSFELEKRFLQRIETNKDHVISIKEFKNIFDNSSENPEIRLFNRVFRIMSYRFIRQEILPYLVQNKKIKDIESMFKYRRVILQGLSEPKKFVCWKMNCSDRRRRRGR